MNAKNNTWDSRLLLLSPKEQRQFWLDELARRAPYGMAVNCRHMPSMSRTPILRKLVEEGLIVRTRESRGGRCNRTVLRLPCEECGLVGEHKMSCSRRYNEQAS